MMRWIRGRAVQIATLMMLVLVGLMLTFVDQFSSKPPRGTLPAVPEGQPDYVLEHVSFTRFDAKGQRYQTMTSPHVAHLPDQEQTSATEPRITVIDSAARRWDISGQRGTMNEDGSKITLSGDALVVAPSEQWRLETNTLYYDRSQDRIWSDSASRFFQGAQTTQGDRFEVLMAPKTLSLNGNVEGVFPPTPAASPATSNAHAPDAP